MTSKFVGLWIVLLCSVFTTAIFAQNSNSTITGTVRDVSGASVPGATIDLTNVGTGQQLSTTSKANGLYSFTNLSPANYKVSVSAQGFAQWVGMLTLRVSQAAQVNPNLTAASVTTRITVKDVTPVIDQVNSTLSDVKETTRIETIPLASRNVLQLLNFTPGVVANSFGGMGAGVTRINGVPGGSLDYLMDGQTMATRWTNELTYNPQPIPTMQEVKIITGNGEAQYTRPGIVEMVTKSGTNHFHGQLFELNQNNVLAAKGFEQTTVSYLNHNEFGGQVGGPVWFPKLYNGRNKTFFFVDIEGIRTDQNKEVRASFPTADWKAGKLSDFVDANGSPVKFYDPESTTLNSVTGAYERTQFSDGGVLNNIPADRLNPIAQKIWAFIPDPNIPGVPYWQGPNYAEAVSKPVRNKLYTAKVDQLFGPNRLAMRYTYTRQNHTSTSYILNPQVESRGDHNGAIVFTQVLGPRLVNVVRGGVEYDNDQIGPVPIQPASIADQVGLPPIGFDVSWFNLAWNDGFTSMVVQNPSDQPDSTITASDQLSYNRGNHQFMFGFDIQDYRINTYEQGQPDGVYNFSGSFSALQDPSQVAGGTFDVAVPGTGDGIADFDLGDVDNIYASIKPHFHTRQTQYSGFAQDNWRVTPKLTLNLGLRYTYWTAFKDASGVESDFDPDVPGGMVVYAGNGALPAWTSQNTLDAFTAGPDGLPIESAAKAGWPLSLWNMPRNNWDPRLGFAYQLTGKSVLRGGWGMYHWALPLQKYQQASRKDPPWSYSVDFSPSFVDSSAAELEFPIASLEYGGPRALNAFQMGAPGVTVDPNDTSQIGWNGGWQVFPMYRNYKAESVQEYNLTLEQELPGHVGARISYVGNDSHNLPMLDPYNYEIPREDCTPAEGGPACVDTDRRPFPLFSTSGASAMAAIRYIGYSNTNSLQAVLNHTFGKSFLLQVFYTWSRTLGTTDTGSGDFGTFNTMVPAPLTSGFTTSNYKSGASDAERLRATYGPDPSLPFHTFSINGHYEFPFGRGKRFLGNAHGFVNELVSGYNISPFFYWRSGLPFAPYFTPYNSSTMLAPGKGGGELPEGQRTINHWFDASIAREDLGEPYAGQAFIRRANSLDDDFRNNSPKNYLTGPGFNNLDATIYKLTPIGKRSTLDIEAQIFNVYNHINWGLPSFTSGVISSQVGGSRLIQLQAKYIF